MRMEVLTMTAKFDPEPLPSCSPLRESSCMAYRPQAQSPSTWSPGGNQKHHIEHRVCQRLVVKGGALAKPELRMTEATRPE